LLALLGVAARGLLFHGECPEGGREEGNCHPATTTSSSHRGQGARAEAQGVRQAHGQGDSGSRVAEISPAIEAFGEALKIFPTDPEAKRARDEAQAALNAENQAQKEADQLQADLTQLVKQGQDSLEKKEYASAVEFFRLAVQKAPSNEDAFKGLRDSREALGRFEAEQKRQADLALYEKNKQPTSIATSSPGKRPSSRHASPTLFARRSLAQAIMPDNFKAVALQKAAEQGLAMLKDEEARKVQYLKFRSRGDSPQESTARGSGSSYKQALALAPNDPPAQKGIADAQALGKRLVEDFQKFAVVGNQAMADKRFADAVNAFREAVKIFPANADAGKALAAAEQAFAQQNAYNQAMGRAAGAFFLKDYNDAILGYIDALAIVPNDPEAVRGLAITQQGRCKMKSSPGKSSTTRSSWPSST